MEKDYVAELLVHLHNCKRFLVEREGKGTQNVVLGHKIVAMYRILPPLYARILFIFICISGFVSITEQC